MAKELLEAAANSENVVPTLLPWWENPSVETEEGGGYAVPPEALEKLSYADLAPAGAGEKLVYNILALWWVHPCDHN